MSGLTPVTGFWTKFATRFIDETVLSAPKFVKAITLLNRRLAEALDGEGSVGNGDFDCGGDAD